jgi:hypothetical protein
LIGEVQSGAKTVEKLRVLSASEEIDSQQLEDLAFKVAAGHSDLQKGISRLKNKVTIVSSVTELINAYSKLISDASIFQTHELIPAHSGDPKFLDKELKNEFSLKNEDGFQVETLSQAFPLMLEIARKSSENNKIIDHAGVELGELIDFKVVLTNPLTNILPFYYKKEDANFVNYYQRLFIDEGGLFQKELKDQLPVVINHIKGAILNKSHQIATRRAILIIPNKVSPDLAPMGLVAIRIIPRYRENNQIELIFSFTWRTVEALVGFPYSFYGSIKYAEYLKSLIAGSLTQHNYQVNFDKIYYVANSLHIFMDDFGQIIAKRIADDASM